MTIRKPQAALALTPADLHGKVLKINVGGSDATVTLSMASGTKFFDRTNSSSDAAKFLVDAISAADPIGGGTWTVLWDVGPDGSVVPGYYWIKRVPEKPFVLKWADAATTLDATLFGFADTITSTNITASPDYDYAPSTYQAGRLWLPDRLVSRPVWEAEPWLEGIRRPADGFTRVHQYGAGPERAEILVSKLHALWVFQSVSSRADYIQALRGGVLGDPNLSLQALLCPLPSSGIIGHNERGPIRWSEDRSAPTSYTEVELALIEDRRGIRALITDERPAPHLLSLALRFQKYSS